MGAMNIKSSLQICKSIEVKKTQTSSLFRESNLGADNLASRTVESGGIGD
jgi:hypothetical protein